MLKLKNKRNCCGCGACFQICPVKCIEMKYDVEGFIYPQVNTGSCTGCGLCLSVCPVIYKARKVNPLKILAAKNRDPQTVFQSSSGGIFSALAENIITQKGFVFGAVYDKEINVEHYGTSNPEEIMLFRTSKYVQSDTKQTFIEVKSLLQNGKPVLFSGTPCQIRGLNLFLGKKYDNLITVDFICHGVPSPGVWRRYLQEILRKNDLNSTNEIKVNFRNKTFGWRKFSLEISTNDGNNLLLQSLKENSFLLGFLKDLYLRPSCHKCPTKGLSSGSDITIADFWGIQSVLPDFNDDKGVSLIILNSGKMENIIRKSCEVRELDSKVLRKNYPLYNSVRKNFNRKIFFREFKKSSELEPIITKYSQQSFPDRFLRRLSIIFSRIFN